MEEISQQFSENLKSFRGKRSQKEFAEFLGLKTQQTYRNYETGRVPSAKILQQIAMKLGVEAGDLLKRIQAFPNAQIIEFPYVSVPEVGAAAAGAGRTFEDLEGEDRVLAEALRDQNAIAIRVEGDSMLPDFRSGQRIVVDTKAEPVPGKPVVLKDVAGNVYFKIYKKDGDLVRLLSLNEVYPELKLRLDQVKWIYKAHGTYVTF